MEIVLTPKAWGSCVEMLWRAVMSDNINRSSNVVWDAPIVLWRGWLGGGMEVKLGVGSQPGGVYYPESG